MQQPDYEAYEQLAATPAEALTEYWSSDFADTIDHPNRAYGGLHIVAAAYAIKRGDFKTGNEILLAAKHKLENHANNITAAMYSRLGLMDVELLLRYPDIHQQRQVLAWAHRDMVAFLEKFLGYIRRDEQDRGTTTGLIAELTTLGLFNRPHNPSVFAVASLFHHGNGKDKAGNYDVLLVDISQAAEKPRYYKLEIKSISAHLETSRYYDDIHIISAKDDFGYNRSRKRKFPVADMLVAEVDGSRNHELDLLHDHLLDRIASGQQARGNAARPECGS